MDMDKESYSGIMIDKETWLKNAPIIKQFIDQLINYEALCQEVAYILENVIQENNIEFSSISYRAKTLKSFLEKINRKKYSDPFKKVTDFAGVRLVFLYKSDFEKIEQIIKENFIYIKPTDKLNDKGTDKFGYSAKHYDVQLSRKHSGPRYNNLKKINCEIQVRTVFQDAWALLDHHLVYKNEVSIPEYLKRQLNSIAGSLELSDDHLCNIKKERQTYIEKIKTLKANPKKFLQLDMDIDSFCQYLGWKFPDIYRETWTGQMNFIFKILQNEFQFKKLKSLDIVIEKSKTKFEEIAPVFKSEKYFNSSSVAVALSVALQNPKFLSNKDIPKEWKAKIIQSEH